MQGSRTNMTIELAEKLILLKFPEMENYMHCLRWTTTKGPLAIGFTTDIPEELRKNVKNYFEHELQNS